MQWDGTATGGFTTGEPWLPFGADAASRAVDLQEADPSSSLHAYRRLLAARRRLLAAGLPDQVQLLDTAPDVLAFRRGSLVVVLNTAAEPVEVEAGAASLLEATADGASVDGGVVTVPSAATVWLTTAAASPPRLLLVTADSGAP